MSGGNLEQHSRSSFRERLGYYALGIAIGLVIVGMMYMGRSAAKARQDATRAPSVSEGATPATPR
ncbi:MAG: hypothetical protein ACKVS8_11545 [Phycisphaerales bacterium]